ncbi:c-type cytochrome, partial [Acidiphilium iwatense]
PAPSAPRVRGPQVNICSMSSAFPLLHPTQELEPPGFPARFKSYNGVMPAWGDQLSNTQIAAILDYIGAAWGNKEAEPAGYKPYDAAAAASARKQTMTSAAVGQLRAKLFAGHTQKH